MVGRTEWTALPRRTAAALLREWGAAHPEALEVELVELARQLAQDLDGLPTGLRVQEQSRVLEEMLFGVAGLMLRAGPRYQVAEEAVWGNALYEAFGALSRTTRSRSRVTAIQNNVDAWHAMAATVRSQIMGEQLRYVRRLVWWTTRRMVSGWWLLSAFGSYAAANHVLEGGRTRVIVGAVAMLCMAIAMWWWLRGPRGYYVEVLDETVLP